MSSSPNASVAPPPGSAARHHNSMFRGVEVLTTLLKAHRSLGVTQIAGKLNLPASTTHDLLAALGAMGFVDHDGKTRRYSISPEIFRFVHLFSSEYGPNSAVRGFLRVQARKLNASIFITALCRQTTYALCASGLEGDTSLLGANGPAYNSSCGKVLVAQRERHEWPDYAPKPEERATSPYSNLEPKQFLAEIEAARVNGVAWQIRERDGVSCSVAAPIGLGPKPWSRAVAIALPYSEWAARDRPELATEVKRLAAEIAALNVA